MKPSAQGFHALAQAGHGVVAVGAAIDQDAEDGIGSNAPDDLDAALEIAAIPPHGAISAQIRDNDAAPRRPGL